MHTFLRVIFIWSWIQFWQSHGEEEWRVRMSVLEKKVEELEREALTRNELILFLSQGITQLTYEGSGIANNSNSGNNGEPQGKEMTEDPGPPPPLTVLETRREVMDSEVKFTVKYILHADDFVIDWFDTLTREHVLIDDPTETSLGDGTWETSFSVSQDDRDGVRVTVKFITRNGYELIIYLCEDDVDAVETDLALPPLNTLPPGDLVYEDGKDIFFKITIPSKKKEDEPTGQDPSYSEYYLLDPDTGKLSNGYGADFLLELVSYNSFPEYQEWNVKIKTSEVKTSGILTLETFESSKTETALVNEIYLGRFITLRPSTQYGPFPPGYLSFLLGGSESFGKLDDGTALVLEVCLRLYDWCAFTCRVAGDVILDLQAYKMEPDGTKTPVSKLPRFTQIQVPVFSRYLRRVEVRFPMNTTAHLDSERFLCIATDVLGNTATSGVVTGYYTDVTILRNESGIEILTPNEASNPLELKIVCKVNGRPQPNVTFTLDIHGSYDYGLSPDEVIDEGKNVYSAIKYSTLDRSNSYGYNNGGLSGKLSSASCRAEIRSPFYDHDYYEIPIPADFED